MLGRTRGPYPHTTVRGITDPKLKSKEAEKILRMLCSGNMMTNFSTKKKTEQRTFVVDLDTRQILWSNKNSQIEGSIPIREIKEIRCGKKSKDFDKMQEESRKLDSKVCFSVFYGNEFNLKVLSVAARQPQECDIWCRGLSHLVIDTLTASNPKQVKRFLQREFNQISKRNPKKVNDGTKFRINLRLTKAWLSNVNAKPISNSQLSAIFREADTSNKGEINFEKFVQFYYCFMHEAQKSVLSFVEQYSADKLRFYAHDFQKFLRDEQKEPWADDINTVKRFMNNYVADSTRRGDHVCLDNKEMLAFLFSKENSIWNPEYLQSPPKGLLDKPISDYWISSSHNTYLTGDQLQSYSSCECYARALRMGCRCIELDCWDGPDGVPVICHGYTLVSKINFLEVLLTIKEHAFVVSDLPVILSIENHCKLLQQRCMATMFSDVFKDSLLVQPASSDDSRLPSPNQLRRKIIIKHKKLDDANRSTETVTELAGDAGDYNNTLKSGLMHLEDPTFAEWNPHFFVLADDKKLVYSETRTEKEDTESSSPQNDYSVYNNEKKTELHYSENWYHGGASRESTEALIRYYSGPDGSFLVRESTMYPGQWTLSFKYGDSAHHCRIMSKFEKGKQSFYLVPAIPFDSLYNLICYYQANPMKNANVRFTLRLTEPIPQPNSHESKEWFHEKITRSQAEETLNRLNRDGAYLVRNCKSDDPNAVSFAISFRAEGKIKHCRIKQEGRLFVIGNASFETLVDVVAFYQLNALYRKYTLRYPATRDIVAKYSKDNKGSSSDIVRGRSRSFVSAPPSKSSVKAIYDFKAHGAAELSFCRGAIITNVTKEEGGWWRGNFESQVDKWFPVNHVEEIESTKGDGLTGANSDTLSLHNDYFGEMQKDSVDLSNCKIEWVIKNDAGRDHSFRIRTANGKTLLLSCATKPELIDWVNVLQECIAKPDNPAKSTKNDKLLKQVAIELSDLIVYCRAVPFPEDGQSKKRHCYEMSSLMETKAERMSSRDKAKSFLAYNRHQLSRVYPKGSRVDSSNYNPIPMWNCGSQLVSLNFQTGDRPMQLNEARFEMYNRCGYVLQHHCMHDQSYDPFVKTTLLDTEPLILNIQIIGARHLPKSGNGITCPFVEVEIQGCEYDNAKAKTPKSEENGLNPTWDSSSSSVSESSFGFDIHCPASAFLRFTVYESDMFGDPTVVATSVIPVLCIKTGLRSVPLKNAHSEEIPLAALLVNLDKRNAKEEDESMYDAIHMLRDQLFDFQHRLNHPNLSSNDMIKYHQQMKETQKAIFVQNEMRKERNIQKSKQKGPKNQR